MVAFSRTGSATVSPAQASHPPSEIADLPLGGTLDSELTKDIFLRQLLRDLAGTLEEVVGLPEAEGFVSVVGSSIGATLDKAYRQALQVDYLDQSTLGQVLVDLKRRVDGDFRVIHEDATTLVLANRRCPFGDKVLNRPSLCMLTSSLFGTIAAENTGYARVEVIDAIARGNTGCTIAIHFVPAPQSDERGHEYFKAMGE